MVTTSLLLLASKLFPADFEAGVFCSSLLALLTFLALTTPEPASGPWLALTPLVLGLMFYYSSCATFIYCSVFWRFKPRDSVDSIWLEPS